MPKPTSSYSARTHTPSQLQYDCTLPALCQQQNGQHYNFVSKEQFCKDIAEGRFLEYAEVHGQLYGTSVSAVQNVRDSGRCCLLDIDVQVGHFKSS